VISEFEEGQRNKTWMLDGFFSVVLNKMCSEPSWTLNYFYGFRLKHHEESLGYNRLFDFNVYCTAMLFSRAFYSSENESVNKKWW